MVGPRLRAACPGGARSADAVPVGVVPEQRRARPDFPCPEAGGSLGVNPEQVSAREASQAVASRLADLDLAGSRGKVVNPGRHLQAVRGDRDVAAAAVAVAVVLRLAARKCTPLSEQGSVFSGYNFLLFTRPGRLSGMGAG